MKACSRIDIILAMKAILFEPGLTNAQKVVAGAIISHFNETDGECDPGADRLAKLLGVSRATVFRTIDALEKHGILSRKSYGGKHHRNAYKPNWSRCRELAKRSHSRTHAGLLPGKWPEV